MKTSTDILIAAFLCVLSSTVWLATYAGIEALSQSPSELETTIKPGFNLYALVHDERCVGSIETELVESGTIHISSKGSINTTYHNKERVTELSIQATFNESNELESANLHIASPLLNLDIDAIGGQEIEVVIAGSMQKQQVEETIMIKGPIIAGVSNDQIFNLAYTEQGLLRPEFWSFLQTSLLSSLKIAVLENKDSGISCSEESLGSVALDPLLKVDERTRFLQ